jgi:hypothetical protein
MKKTFFLLIMILLLSCQKEDPSEHKPGTFDCTIYFVENNNCAAVDSFRVTNPTVDFLDRCEDPIPAGSGFYITFCKKQ